MQLIRIAALAAAIACSALSMQAQSKSKGKGKAKAVPAAKVTPALTAPTDGPTFCYALGVAQGESMKNYLISREGVDSAYVKYAIEGMNATLSDDERKRRIAFAAGMRIAEMNQKQLPMIAKQAAGANDSAYIKLPAFQRGLTEAALGQNTTFSADSAMKLVDAQLKFQRDTYKHDNVAWLANNKQLKGVTTLPSGLQYRVLTQGKGAVATDSTEVEVHYEGRLIDGTVFDSSYKRGKPSTFRPDQVIKGWREALTLMPEGSIWELYIPAELGYGERGSGQTIPGNSTLIFQVEIIKVKK